MGKIFYSLVFFTICCLLSQICCESETLLGKIFAGYQGWFTTQQDGSGNGWTHYKMRSGAFAKNNCVIDFWPDTSEYEKKYPVNEFGSGFNLFSPYDYSTVKKHFQWMKTYQIHGVFLQRFGSDIRNKGSNMWKFKNRVFENVRNAAKQNGRLWSLMYDLSGMGPGQLKSIIIEDWKYLNTQYNFKNDDSYIKHRGKPLITVWGIGFNDNRKYTLSQSLELVEYLKNDGNSVMLGTPRYWRQGGKDCVTGNDLNLLHNIIQKSDVVSPWAVGRYNSISGAQIDAKIYVKADLQWCNSRHVTLMPVIFPGFSWHNLQVSGQNPDHPGPYDQIPRKQNGTYFLQVQGQQIVKVGAKTIYVAMFDQMNEGTAIFKCVKNPPSLSDGLKFVGYQQDPGFYLNMTGKIGQSIKSNIISELTF